MNVFGGVIEGKVYFKMASVDCATKTVIGNRYVAMDSYSATDMKANWVQSTIAGSVYSVIDLECIEGHAWRFLPLVR